MDIKMQVELAKLELEGRQAAFNNARTKDEIDIATYELQAAELRLNSLLKKAKVMN